MKINYSMKAYNILFKTLFSVYFFSSIANSMENSNFIDSRYKFETSHGEVAAYITKNRVDPILKALLYNFAISLEEQDKNKIIFLRLDKESIKFLARTIGEIYCILDKQWTIDSLDQLLKELAGKLYELHCDEAFFFRLYEKIIFIIGVMQKKTGLAFHNNSRVLIEEFKKKLDFEIKEYNFLKNKGIAAKWCISLLISFLLASQAKTSDNQILIFCIAMSVFSVICCCLPEDTDSIKCKILKNIKEYLKLVEPANMDLKLKSFYELENTDEIVDYRKYSVFINGEYVPFIFPKNLIQRIAFTTEND